MKSYFLIGILLLNPIMLTAHKGPYGLSRTNQKNLASFYNQRKKKPVAKNNQSKQIIYQTVPKKEFTCPLSCDDIILACMCSALGTIYVLGIVYACPVGAN